MLVFCSELPSGAGKETSAGAACLMADKGQERPPAASPEGGVSEAVGSRPEFKCLSLLKGKRAALHLTAGL
jgi:hypothetical protein